MLRAAHSMINPGQFVLELILVVAALALSRSLAGKQHRSFVIGFASLAAAANCAFYYFAVGPLYLARGFDRSVLAGAVTFETIRWGVLAFVLSRLATRLQDAGLDHLDSLCARIPIELVRRTGNWHRRGRGCDSYVCTR